MFDFPDFYSLNFLIQGFERCLIQYKNWRSPEGFGARDTETFSRQSQEQTQQPLQVKMNLSLYCWIIDISRSTISSFNFILLWMSLASPVLFITELNKSKVQFMLGLAKLRYVDI